MTQSLVDLRHNSISNDDYRDVLETKRVEIVHCLNLERNLLLNYLRGNHVFDEEDCEIIMAEKANCGRAGKLIDFLLKKGPDAYQHFLDVIQVENATLFESLTGDKATSRPSPIMKQLANHELQDEDGDSFPNQILVEHLQRTYGNLHDISLKFTNALKAKNDIEEKLLKTESNLEFEKERRIEYEKRVSKVIHADENIEARNLFLLSECDDLQKGIADRDVYIIAIQMKLLSEKEECERLRCKLDEVEQKNETMAGQLRRVSDNYNRARGHSLKLNQHIRMQVDKIQKMEDLEKQIDLAKLDNTLLRSERDETEERLKELKKWTQALKARFDAEVEEKNKEIEKSANFFKLQETVRNLQRKLSLSQVEMEDCVKRSERFEKDSETCRNQRDRVLEARKESILQRDKVVAEKEKIQMQYNELQCKYEKVEEEREALFQEYDATKKRYETTLQETGAIKRKLNEKEMEAEDLNRLLTEAEGKNCRNSQLMESIPPKSSIERINESSQLYDGPKKETEMTAQTNPWRERRLKSLLKSIKLRISGERFEEDDITEEQESPLPGTMTWELLQVLLPNLSSRPYSSLPRTNWENAAKKTREERESKSSTLPIMKPSPVVNFSNDAEKPFVDDMAFSEPFRKRTRPIPRNYQRSNSVI